MSSSKFVKKYEYLLLTILIISPVAMSLDFIRTGIPTIIFVFSLIIFLLVLLSNYMYVKKSTNFKYILISGLIFLMLEFYNRSSLYDLKLPIIICSSCIFTSLSISILLGKSNYKKFLLYFSKVIVLLSVFFTLYSITNILFKITVFEDSRGYYYQISEIFPNILLRQKVMGLGLAKRYSSMFSNPNGFGMFIMSTIPFYIMIVKERLFNKNVNRLLGIIIISGLLLSQSRASFLSTACFIILLVLFSRFSKVMDRKTIRNTLISVSIVIIITLVLFTLRSDFTLNGRLEPWSIALETFKKNPITGIGTINFNRYIASKDFIHSHNTYLQLLASGGVTYLTIYIIFIFAVLYSNTKNISNKETSFYHKVIIAYILSVLFYQIFELNLLIYHYQILIFILLAQISEIMNNDSRYNEDKVMTKLRNYIRFLIQVPFTIKAPSYKVLSSNDTLRLIRDENISLIRLGDEETIISNYGGIHYQDYDENLTEDLNKVINDFNSDSSKNYILAVPRPFLNKNIFNLGSVRYVKIWTQARYYFKRIIKQDIVYGDSFCLSKSNIPEFLDIVSSKFETVIFVHNDIKYTKQLEEVVITVKFVKVPPSNAYDFVEDITYRIIKEYRESAINNEKTCVIISCGPAAKIISFKLTKENIIVYDTGHCWDEPLYDPTDI